MDRTLLVVIKRELVGQIEIVKNENFEHVNSTGNYKDVKWDLVNGGEAIVNILVGVTKFKAIRETAEMLDINPMMLKTYELSRDQNSII